MIEIRRLAALTLLATAVVAPTSAAAEAHAAGANPTEAHAAGANPTEAHAAGANPTEAHAAGANSTGANSAGTPAYRRDAAGNLVTRLTAATFADPPQNDMPWARWNFPPATATVAGLEADLQDAYEHNIGGVEIGQGGDPTKEQLLAIYRKANALGITVSLKAANGLPGATYSPADPYARRTLEPSRQVVDGGATLNAAVPGTATGTIVAVLAYRCAAGTCASTGDVVLDPGSTQDLTGRLTGTNTAGYQGGSTAGTLGWTAPAGGQWVVLTFRAVPFGNQPETLSAAGTRQLTKAYDDYFAGELGTLVERNGGDIFVDSHATDPWGAPEELWSSSMRAEFRARAGYDIVTRLAALVDPTMAGASLSGAPTTAPSYSFSDGSATRIRSDFNRVRSTLFTENRIEPFQRWAHRYGTQLRLQQEDGPVTSIGDQLETSAALDRSEYESLTGSDQADIYRPMASAAHMTGNSWYSTECCAALNESYVQTYQDAFIRMNHEFAAGVNRIVYHIRPYVDTPATTWPGLGFSANKVAFSNAWNRTQPSWVDAAAMNDSFARTHLVLSQGTAKLDVAVYLRNYSSPAAFATTDPSNRHWQDLGLQRAGYTWDYLDEHLFDLPNAVVTNKRLAEDGPGYRALVFDQGLYPTTNTARGSMTVEAARDILRYAKAGLPVVFVGTPTGTGGMPAAGDAVLKGLVAQILAQRGTVRVSSEAEVPAALARLGITPQAQPATPGNLLSVRRSDASTGTDYYYLYNQGVESYPASTSVFGRNPSNVYEEPAACRVTTAVNPCMATGDPLDTTVTLQGTGDPYLLDTFTGAVTPIVRFTRKGNTVTVRTKLPRDASTVIALTRNPRALGLASAGPAVTATTADSAALAGGSLVVRASAAGRYRTTLADGRTVTSTIGAVPAPIDLTGAGWHLDAEDWQPTNPYGTTGAAGTLTTRKPVSVDLTALAAWPDIPALRDASGIGTYTTTVTLPGTWDATHGATLSLGAVTDTFTLTVNGHSVPVDQLTATVDVGEFLHAGRNTLAVRVTTTLNNRLAALDQAVRDRGIVQNYGLVGPVVLTPYRQATVGTAR